MCNWIWIPISSYICFNIIFLIWFGDRWSVIWMYAILLFTICLYIGNRFFIAQSIRPMFLINKHFNYYCVNYPTLVWWFRIFLLIDKCAISLNVDPQHKATASPFNWITWTYMIHGRKQIKNNHINHIRSHDSGKCDVSYVQWISDSIFAYSKH